MQWQWFVCAFFHLLPSIAHNLQFYLIACHQNNHKRATINSNRNTTNRISIDDIQFFFLNEILQLVEHEHFMYIVYGMWNCKSMFDRMPFDMYRAQDLFFDSVKYWWKKMGPWKIAEINCKTYLGNEIFRRNLKNKTTKKQTNRSQCKANYNWDSTSTLYAYVLMLKHFF